MHEGTRGAGFVGVDGQGEEQVRAFAALPGIRIQAICDLDGARRGDRRASGAQLGCRKQMKHVGE
jgi:hypothetical protein